MLPILVFVIFSVPKNVGALNILKSMGIEYCTYTVAHVFLPCLKSGLLGLSAMFLECIYIDRCIKSSRTVLY